MSEGSPFRRACAIFLGSLAFFWAVAVIFLGFWATRESRSFSWHPLFYNRLLSPFSDFVLLDWSILRFPKSSSLPPVVYPAPLMCVYVFFGLFSSYRLESFEALIAVAVVVGVIFFSKALARVTGESWLLTGSYVLAAAFLCYPFWFELERANLEIVVWIAQALAVVFLLKRRYIFAAVLIGIAASMKFYPALLLAIPFSRKKYHAIAICLISAAVFQLASLAILGPSISAANREVVDGLRIVTKTRVFTFDVADSGYEHSLLSVAKQAFHWVGRRSGWSADRRNEHILQLAIPYFSLIAAGGLSLYWWRIRKLTLSNQIVVLLALSTVMPPMALEYALIEITIAWSVYLFSVAKVSPRTIGIPSWAISLTMISFAVVFLPGFYLRIRGIGLAGELKLMALCTIIYLVCRYPIPEATDPIRIVQ